MKKIAVFTGTRAEYGLLFWLLKAIQKSSEAELQLIVSAMHLSPEFGLTYEQIIADGFKIDAKVETLLSSDTQVGVAKAMGLGCIGYADALDRLRPDMIVILGDRYEALAMAQTSLIMSVPIAHIHGGELTEGAYDDAIRHAITKMSHLHFPAVEEYRQRIIQMGESPDAVYTTGAIGLDHIRKSTLLSLEQLNEQLLFELNKPYFVVTYHPETLDKMAGGDGLRNLIKALDSFPECKVIITYSNADHGGRTLINELKQYASEQPSRVYLTKSLGSEKYLSLMSHAALVIGNSSSGLIEAPAFNVPSINIGERQRGRLRASTVIDCDSSYDAILSSIRKGLCSNFIKEAKRVNYFPYGKGLASELIVRKIFDFDKNTKKRFYDMDVSV